MLLQFDFRTYLNNNFYLINNGWGTEITGEDPNGR